MFDLINYTIGTNSKYFFSGKWKYLNTHNKVQRFHEYAILYHANMHKLNRMLKF